MPELAPTAVTLKINRTSVMLYACHYVRLPEGVGATVQTYLGSFPVTATEVPANFAALLREAAERQRVAVGQALDWATQALRELPTMANYATVILTPNAQAALAGLLAAAERLAADAGGAPAVPAPAAPGR